VSSSGGEEGGEGIKGIEPERFEHPAPAIPKTVSLLNNVFNNDAEKDGITNMGLRLLLSTLLG
jgi:hypothetical protein